MTTRNLWLLLKKNLIVERRSYIQISIEIITILAIFCVLLLIKSPETLSRIHFKRDMELKELSWFKKQMLITEPTIPYKIFFTPDNEYNQDIMKITSERLNLLNPVGFETEKDMIDNFDVSSILAGVILESENVTLRFPNYFRSRPDKNFFKFDHFWLTRCRNVLSDDADFYIREGFLQLLYAIVTAQIEKADMELSTIYHMFSRISSMFHVREPEMNCVNDVSNKPLTPEKYLEWSLYYFIYFVPFINLIWKFSRECEENIFAHHWTYGFSYNDQRFAHLLVSLLHLISLDILVFLALIILWPPLSIGKLLTLFAFLILHNMLLIFYAIALSSAIKNAKTAVWCGATMWIALYAICLETLNSMNFDLLSTKILIISVIFFNNLFPNGLMDYFKDDEGKSSKETMLLLGVQSLILLLYGCLFMCFDHNWHKRLMQKFRSKDCKEIGCGLYENHIEYGPLNGEVLQLKNVYSYCNPCKIKPQLRNISMRIFMNEISVILGSHNCGKSEFIRTLAGWEAYKGRIAFLGENISENWPYYRQHVDVSLTNNALFDLLTIQETIEYFISLKQNIDTQVKFELDKWLNVLNPLVDCQKLVKTLSFDEKRILALCCTMTCNTSVVLLDNPTVYMRSEEQNKYWNILKQEKQNRAIIVTTFSPDEANEIGDRIGILNDGCLITWGTPYFVRSKLGGQFYLTCFLRPMTSIEPITKLIEKYITNLKIHNQFRDRIIYIIPADKKTIYQRLFLDLEQNFSTLGITNVYMASSGLNEAYMNFTMKPKKQINFPDIKKTLKFIQDQRSQLKKSFTRAYLYKKLLYQSKHILPLCTIFISFFLILAICQIVPASLNVDRITFYFQREYKNVNHSLVQIYTPDDIRHGVFYYKNFELLDETYENKSRKNFNSLAAFETHDINRNMWFNERVFHSAPMSINLAFNYISNPITYINKPIMLRRDYDMHVILGIIMPLTMSTVFVNLQQERISSMMTLQKIAGLTDTTKWSVTFLWDISICFLISILYLVILIACAMFKATWPIVLGALILFLLCGIANLLFIYLVSLFVYDDDKIRAFAKIFFMQLIMGLLPYVFYMNILQGNFDSLFYVFMILPGFSVLHGTTKIFDNYEKPNLSSYFQWSSPGILDSIIFICFISVFFFVVFFAVVIYRRAYLKSVPKQVKTFASVCYPYDDDRVVTERIRISNMNLDSCRAQVVLVDQLESELPKKGNRINSISFVVNKQSCFGIYGSHHSGKSHIIKQLVGEQGFWFGEVYICGFSLKKQMANVLKHIGYCPQSKGFNSLLSTYELLKYFLMLNGVKESKHLDYLRNIIESLQLRKYMNSKIGDLPQNIKRRLNVAVALIARNRILIFDEPTRGLPAFDRRLIWNIIKYCRSLDNTIIFATSESLELKELADFAVIVNDGEMLSYDSPHKMEYQFNYGFYLEIKLFADGVTLEEVEENLDCDMENLNRFVMFFHENSELLYRCNNVCKYYIPIENVTYSYIFGSIEKNRNRLNINDYTLAPFSLNKVLKVLQKSHKEKVRHERARTSLLKDPKTLPRRY